MNHGAREYFQMRMADPGDPVTEQPGGRKEEELVEELVGAGGGDASPDDDQETTVAKVPRYFFYTYIQHNIGANDIFRWLFLDGFILKKV